MTSSTRLYLAVTVLILVPTAGLSQDIFDQIISDQPFSNRAIQVFLLVTILSIAPGILIMVTCFPFIVVVLSILRQAIGLQQSPPNLLIVSLALFLTYFIMQPVFLEAWQVGIEPFTRSELEVEAAFLKAMQPFREFMETRVSPDTYSALQDIRSDGQVSGSGAESELSLLIPAFLLSEISRAFQIGFLIFLPFVIIDLVVAAVLMSMGMMMVPPAIVSLPFKLAFFVVADGWVLISTSLVQSYF